MDKLISSILSTRRAHNSPGELAFLQALHEKIKALGFEPVSMSEGCVSVKVGPAPVMFSCHIDTVHGVTESNGQGQKLFFDESFQHIFLEDKDAGCLGADDGAGIYVMLRMIEEKVSGTYVFHRGEERGGIGSRAMVRDHAEWAKKFHMCVAFDRPNSHEIIATQGGQRCASDAYCGALAKAFNDLNADFKYEISHKGSFTDSKVYAHLIPECVNIGVGYTNQHSSEEYLDWKHLQDLTKACIKLDWGSLPKERKPDQPALYGGNKGTGWTQRDFAQMEQRLLAAGMSQGTNQGKGKGKKHTLNTQASMLPQINGKGIHVGPGLRDVEAQAPADADDLANMNHAELLEELQDTEVVRYIAELRIQLAKAEAEAAELRNLFCLDV